MAAQFTRRTVTEMIVLMVITLGIYALYWLYVTKEELNSNRAQLPTFFLFFIPLANFYFMYKFAEAFCAIVLRNKSQSVAYFLLLVFLLPVGELILQSQINRRRGMFS
jgi:hypothetical protein